MLSDSVSDEVDAATYLDWEHVDDDNKEQKQGQPTVFSLSTAQDMDVRGT